MTPEQELAVLISVLTSLHIGRKELPEWAQFRLEVWHREHEARRKLLP